METQVHRLTAAQRPGRSALRRAWQRLAALQAALRQHADDDPLKRRVRRLAWELDRLDPDRCLPEDRARERAAGNLRRPRDTELHRWITQQSQRLEEEREER